jgi:hypothetical protein
MYLIVVKKDGWMDGCVSDCWEYDWEGYLKRKGSHTQVVEEWKCTCRAHQSPRWSNWNVYGKL